MPADPPVPIPEKIGLFIVMVAVFAGSYIALQTYPLFAPRTLPLTFVDRALPFAVWTVWPYLALQLSAAVLPFLVRGRVAFRRMVKAALLAVAICVAFWALWPTTMIRPPVPTGDSLSELLYRFYLRVDAPTNCLPSAHVAIPAILVEFNARARPAAALWLRAGLLVMSLSVVTTRQHYFWDLLAGLAVAALAVFLVHRER